MTTIDQLSALDKFKSVGKDRYVACCPAHDDKSPSLSLTDVGGKVLFYCFAGCSQAEVIDALRARGLWHKPASSESGFRRDELDYMTHYCLVWNGSVRRGLDIPHHETETMESFLHALSVHSPSHYRRVVRDAAHE
jgi:hypothetical protein